nr:type II toxin-antitoxin system RelE/ParE family toxin [uncultured Devosia sp.]
MRVRWTKPALANLDEIQTYVAQESPLAAYRLAQDLFGRTQNGLATSPMMGRQGRAPGTRELVFADLPYIVVYRMTDAIDILAVVHTARRWPKAFE